MPFHSRTTQRAVAGWGRSRTRAQQGGKLLHILTGNLSHQIEHHLFPDVPANRYAEMAVAVRDICRRYGVHYNTGSMAWQFSQVVWRILRHAFPSQPPRAAAA